MNRRLMLSILTLCCVSLALGQFELEWLRSYDLGFDETPNAVIVTSDGKYAVTGHLDGTDDDLFLLKLDSNGDVIPPFLAVSKSRYYATLLASLGGKPPFAVCGLSLL